MEEIWKDIEGYEKLYQISSFGRVRRWKRKLKQWYYIKPYPINSGYLMVTLSVNNTKKKFLVHRLVAEAFLPNTEKHPCINHIDCVKTNNMASNLEWCTYFTNNQPNKKNGTGRRPVYQIKDGVVVGEYVSIADAAEKTGFLYSAISNALTGRSKTAYGYNWEYKKAG